jgi:hypothetical protein
LWQLDVDGRNVGLRLSGLGRARGRVLYLEVVVEATAGVKFFDFGHCQLEDGRGETKHFGD